MGLVDLGSIIGCFVKNRSDDNHVFSNFVTNAVEDQFVFLV